MKRSLLFAFLFLGALWSFGQSGAQPYLFQNADGLLIQQRVAEDPTIVNRYMIYEDQLKQWMEPSAKTDTLIDGKRIIPVVVHVIHKGGPENISKAQIEDAIALLNIDYNKLNTDTTAASSWPAFASRRADCQVEFRLAKIDPDGNCTEGIVRHYDPQTNYAYFTTMSQYAWSPSRYLNIFTVNFIYPEGIALPDGAFIGGMSPFPPSNALSQALTGGDTLADGILIRHDCVGSIGTAVTMGGMPINAMNRTLTHESGHYYNLYHPFQNMMLGLLPASSGCPSFLAPNGDEVDDTPPVDVATQNVSISCYVPGSRNTCNQDNPDEPDMVENYMDYQWGYCTNIFTLGQLDRINATLNGDRRKLWSYENLIFTGVLDTNAPSCVPIADFMANHFVLCAGGNVSFLDQSYGGVVDNWNWTFTGGTPSTSTDQNPVVVYDTPGTYPVKLMVSNLNGADSLIRNAYVLVADPATADTTPIIEDFETTTLNDWIILNDVGNAWALTNTASVSGSKSLALMNFDNNTAGGYDEIISPIFDLTTLPDGALPLLTFQLAYTARYDAGTILTGPDTIYDRLSLYVSNDCGATWTQKYNKTGENLVTTPGYADDFVPTDTMWRQESVSLSYSSLSESDVRFKFVFYSNGGNNLYIDDINITSPWFGTEETLLDPAHVNIYPNPTNDKADICFYVPTAVPVTVRVYDLTGRLIYTTDETIFSQGGHTLTLSKEDLGGRGAYIVNVRVDDRTVNKKLIIQ